MGSEDDMASLRTEAAWKELSQKRIRSSAKRRCDVLVLWHLQWKENLGSSVVFFASTIERNSMTVANR